MNKQFSSSDGRFCNFSCVTLIRSILTLALLWTGFPARAEESLAVRPDPEGTPTQISLSLFLVDLKKVDGAEQLVNVDFFVRADWLDERLNSQDARNWDVSEIWQPQLQVANEGRLFTRMPTKVSSDGEGNATFLQRYVGTLSIPLNLADFPFDTQRLWIHIVSGRPETEVEITINEDRTGRAPNFSVPDWTINSTSARSLPFQAPTGVDHQGLVFEVFAKRQVSFYIWKILLPLTLVVIMSWMVFWLDDVQVSSQLSVAVTSMLTMIAYRFVLGRLLPNLPYLTRLDIFSLSATFLVFLAMIEVVITSNLATKGKGEQSKRVDRFCRWAFPVVFAGVFWFTVAG